MIDEAILNAMHRSFGNAIKRIFMPRFSRYFTFREPNCGEQKTFSKIVLANQDSQATVYGATMALIRKLALDKDFNQFRLNEMERIIILATLFSTNFLTKQISIKCPNKECNHQFTFNIKHGELIKNLEKLDLSDIIYDETNEIGHIKAIINYPSTKKYLKFLEYIEDESAMAESENKDIEELDKYAKMDHAFDDMYSNPANPTSPTNKRDSAIADLLVKRKNALKKDLKSSKAAGNIDMRNIDVKMVGLNSVDLYIKKIEWTVNGDENNYEVTFDDNIIFPEIETILGGFPVAFLSKEDGTTLSEFIANELYERINRAVPTIICPKCNTNVSNGIRLYDFFIAG